MHRLSSFGTSGLSCGLLLIALSQLLLVSGQVSLFFNASQEDCLFDIDCAITSFCDRPSRGALRGVCSQCWRCCLYPDLYKDCPDSCNCVEGAGCSSPNDCGLGLFCAINPTDIFAVPTCQKCGSCLADVQSITGGCAPACPSGPLDSSPHQESLDRFMFVAFSAAEISPSADSIQSGTLALSDLSDWVHEQGFNGSQVNSIVSSLDSSGTDPMLVSTMVTSLINNAPLSIFCPTLPPTGSPASPRAVVYGGCPCNATNNAAGFACPAGFRCSEAAYQGLSTGKVTQATAEELKAVCVACTQGQHCPQASFALNESDLSAFVCPDGFFCPTPDRMEPCPAGTYCLQGASEPVSCNYEELLETNPYMDLPQEPITVLRRLRNEGDPMFGNICPAGATKSTAKCPSGYYCPDVASQIICPSGYYCKGQDIEPEKCAPLTSCPEGTGKPNFSWLAFVIAGVIIICLPLIYWLLKWLDPSSRVAKHATMEAASRPPLKKSVPFAITNNLKRANQSRKLNLDCVDNPVVLKYSGFGLVKTKIEMSFESLGLRLKKQQVSILAGVSGYFPPGRLNAVMGPSGSGKTTFLNVISGKVTGRNTQITGKIRINGGEMSLTKLKKITGFVPQDDIVHEDLSVRENMYYAANLLLPHGQNDAKRRAHIVNDVLNMMQIMHIEHFRVGNVEKRGISGGQRKRVSIGLELVTCPSCLFLDEPTSGLDSTASSDILKSLADMAALGMNILAVIHQPRFSSYMLFDQVLLLGWGGKTVFMGHPGVAVLYFDRGLHFRIPRRENPADVLMDVIGGKVFRMCGDGKDELQVDHDFEPADLAKWWKGNGHRWVEELDRLNPMMTEQDVIMDEETIQLISEEFRHVASSTKDERVKVNQLLEIFDALEQPMPAEDALLLMRHVHNSVKRADRAEDMDDDDDDQASVTDEDLTISRVELIDALQSMVRKKAAEAKIDPLDKFSSLEARYVFPKIDITSATKAQMNQSVARLTRLPSFESDHEVVEIEAVRGGASTNRKSQDEQQRVSPLPGSPFPLGEVNEFSYSQGTNSLMDEADNMIEVMRQQGHLPDALEPLPYKRAPNLHSSPPHMRVMAPVLAAASPLQPLTPPTSDGRRLQHQLSYDVGSPLAESTRRGTTSPTGAQRSWIINARRNLGSVFLQDPASLTPNSQGTPACRSQAALFGVTPSPQDPASVLSPPTEPRPFSTWAGQGGAGFGGGPSPAPGPIGEGLEEEEEGAVPGTVEADSSYPSTLTLSNNTALAQTASHNDASASASYTPLAASNSSSAATAAALANTLSHNNASTSAIYPLLAASTSMSAASVAALAKTLSHSDASASASYPSLPPSYSMAAAAAAATTDGVDAVHDVLRNQFEEELRTLDSAHNPSDRISQQAKAMKTALPGLDSSPGADETEGSKKRTSNNRSSNKSRNSNAVHPLDSEEANVTGKKRAKGRRGSTRNEDNEELAVEALLGGVLQKSMHMTRLASVTAGGAGGLRASSTRGPRGAASMTARGAPSMTSGRQTQSQAGARRGMSTTSQSHLPTLPDALVTAMNKMQDSGAGLTPLELEIQKWNYPGFFSQLYFISTRSLVKYMRSYWPLRVIDILLLIAGAFIIGFIHGTAWGLGSIPSNTAMAMTCLGVLSTVTHLRTFTTDKIVLLRESDSGVSLPAFFCAQNIIDLGWVFLAPALFLAPYYYLTLPRIAFSSYYIAALQVCWWCSGMSYMVATAVPKQTVLMTGVFCALILGAFVQGITPSVAEARGTVLEYILGLSYSRWAVELVTVEESMHFVDNMRNVVIMLFRGIGYCGMDELLYVEGGDDDDLTPREAISFLQVQRTFTFSHCDSYNTEAHIAMFCLGLGFRVIAFVCLMFLKKSQY